MRAPRFAPFSVGGQLSRLPFCVTFIVPSSLGPATENMNQAGALAPRRVVLHATKNRKRGKLAALVSCVGISLLSVCEVDAQVTLTGTSYSQDFDSIGSGLPTGWTGRTSASATSIGTVATFAAAKTNWPDTTGQFANYSSNNIASSSSSGTQDANTNRAFGVRQIGSGSFDPGAAFTLQIANTSNLTNFTMDFDLMTLSNQTRTTTYTIRYGLGSSPTSFTTLGTYTSGTFTDTHFSFNSIDLAGIENQNQNVWIQVVALTASTGSGSRDTVAIDDFSLTYSPVPEPASFAAGALALLAIFWQQRRRLNLLSRSRST